MTKVSRFQTSTEFQTSKKRALALENYLKITMQNMKVIPFFFNDFITCQKEGKKLNLIPILNWIKLMEGYMCFRPWPQVQMMK